MKLKYRRPNITKEKKEQIRKEFLEGKGTKQLSVEYNRSQRNIEKDVSDLLQIQINKKYNYILQKINKLTDFEKGWIAGIIDGDGSIFLSKHHQRDQYHPSVAVMTTDNFITKKLYCLLGGKVHLDVKKNPKHKNGIRWSYTNILSVRAFCNIFKDLLVLKNRQAKLLEEYCISRMCNSTEYTQREKNIYILMKQLNQKGIIQDGDSRIDYRSEVLPCI